VTAITEDLITDLSKISGLFVISRNSSLSTGQSSQTRTGQSRAGRRYVVEAVSVRRAPGCASRSR